MMNLGQACYIMGKELSKPQGTLEERILNGICNIIPDEISISTRPIKQIIRGDRVDFERIVSVNYYEADGSITRYMYPNNLIEVIEYIPEQYRYQYNNEKENDLK